MMNILVIGANGQIGKHIVRQLNQMNEYKVTAMIRKPEQAAFFTELKVNHVIGDLEGTVEELSSIMKNTDIVIFTAGSGGNTGADKTMLIDLDGAVKSIEAAEQANVSRYIMISAIHANDRTKWLEPIKHYHAAKHYADKHLMESTLQYTIIRPGRLTNEAGTGHISVGNNLTRADISREDVAKTVVASIQEKATYNQSFDLVEGTTDIKDALLSLDSTNHN